MKITKIEINNYRNLSGLNIYFDETCNFIVGENNVGKSNLLWLLNTVLATTNRSFNPEDFKDQDKPIEIILELKLDDIEVGNFGAYFNHEDERLIRIIARQGSIDEIIEFFHKETNAPIRSEYIRCINFIHYDSLRNPITEINFDKGKGVGKFLKNIVSKYLKNNQIADTDFIDPQKIETLITMINGNLSKIKSFKDYDISASADNDIESLLSKLIILKDAKGDNLTKAGYGVQFLILVTLSILEKIQFITHQRGKKAIFESDNGEKAISLVLGLDEPEIHLHPYLQRTLIKYLKEIISNKNEDFKQLIKDLFDIDEFVGQIIVVTHSPNIVLDDYHQITRFFTKKQRLSIKCGSQLKNIDSNKNLQKHLYLHFPFIKEAFFAKCVIFVEGDSEFASLPTLGEKLFADFDDLGICVIQARGEAVAKLMQVADSFGIPSVGITDKDDGEKKSSSPTHYQTNLRDFEEEFIDLLLKAGQERTLRAILIEYDPKGIERIMNVEALKNRASRYKVIDYEYMIDLKLADILDSDILNLKSYYLTWFSINKSFPLGKLIGDTLSSEQIPTIYKTVIEKAYNLTRENV